MFSIAAINDTDSQGQWEPLAPSKEAQESRLSQTYHEGLLQLQAKEYTKARELLESVLKDPLISSAQVGDDASDGHLLQLRFFALKNLATVFLQQGSAHYENALNCYLQAVEIDTKDSVVWNQLGTLSCTMGLLSISRWAFEQGLYCSPNNWNCMEKLLEVLITIGDEVACLSVAELILRHWPSHSRALYVKRTIEESEPIPFVPRGIDKLEPKHIRLRFPDKRKSTDESMVENIAVKRQNQNTELLLAEASWGALADGVLIILLSTSRSSSQVVGGNRDVSVNDYLGCKLAKVVVGDGDSMESRTLESSHRFTKLHRHGDNRVVIHLPANLETVMDPAEGKMSNIRIGENVPISDLLTEKSSTVKEKDTSMDEEHPQERRSTRLERLRNRKPGKEELDSASSKDLAKVVFQFLEPFIVDRSLTQDSESVTAPNVAASSTDPEDNDIAVFIKKALNNYGAYHLGHLLLEEVARLNLPYQESFVKLLELEKLTRQWGQDRTTDCSLFLAELYYDFGSHPDNESKSSEFFSEASYHLCKVIELAALDCVANLPGALDRDNYSNTLAIEESGQQEPAVSDSHLNPKRNFWTRFFWLSGRLSVSSGDKAKGYEEFCMSLSHFTNGIKENDHPCVLSLPHCKLVKGLNVERIVHEIHLLEVDMLLRKTAAEMVEKAEYLECVNLLSPLLLCNKDIYLDLLSGAYKEGTGVTSIELLALDVLISACEKAQPMAIEVLLKCHWRKLQILTVAAGMFKPPVSHEALHKSSMLKTSGDPEGETIENIPKHWNYLVAEEIKAISRCASQIKSYVDHSGSSDCLSAPISVVGDIQSLILTVMYNIVGILLYQKSSGVFTGSQSELESQCFVDAAIAFCKLQHLNPTIPIKTQVELILAIHELLAEHGLCCAGKDSEGEGGIFLKLAIKHLLALDMKLKSSCQSSHRELETKQRDDYFSHDKHVKTSVTASKSNASPTVHVSMAEKKGVREKDTLGETTLDSPSSHEARDKEGVEIGKEAFMKEKKEEKESSEVECGDHHIDVEREKVELGIDNALEQSFFCLYGLNLKCGPDTSDDELAIHRNTSRGDYQTKEQCADVFHYILPYAKASSRAGLVKLRRVLRAIRRHFPQPPEDILKENSIDLFLDNPDLCEEKLHKATVSDESPESVTNIIFPNGTSLKTCKISSTASSEPYLEVYSNLYYLLSQAEEMSATDKWPGFVLTKEGEEFVEQNANLFKYDLLYNPLRFESWQRLANIYDEEVDLLLNDGSKHKNVMEWRKHESLPQRVEVSRRRSRRCLLVSLALAKTSDQQSQIHELLALVYYDSLQNVVPLYDQRSIIPMKDAAWLTLCRNSLKHFKKAFKHKPDWSHALYLGKLCEKLGYSCKKAFSYYNKAITLNPSAVDPVYRMHASRLKLLYKCGKKNFDSLQVVAAYAFSEATKETILNIFGWTTQDLVQLQKDIKDESLEADSQKERECPGMNQLEEAWHALYNDCLSALEVCVEGELKHFHKARYMLAQGLRKRDGSGDLERAKDELSFCFRSSRSTFTINMWEIDGMVKKARRKTPGIGGNKKALEVSLPESSRKFITCIRKYTLLYLNLLEETGDFCTLDRAYTSLRTDKRFSLCLEDIAPVALGRYIQALAKSIRHAETLCLITVEHLLERMFTLFMDHGNLWTDISSLPELKKPELSESSLFSYIHLYIQSLERDARLDVLEGINEKIRKRFKNPKLSNNNCAKICKHASVAWCRSILISLSLITPLRDENPSGQAHTLVAGGSEPGLLLYVDLQINELWNLSFVDEEHQKALETKWSQVLSRMKGVLIKQVAEENLEKATTLLRCTYNFYRESSCGALPSGINLYTVPSQSAMEGACPPPIESSDFLDLSIPRKLLLWAHTLVHGHYSNILAVVKHCEENAKSRIKKGSATSSALSHSSIPTCNPHAVAAGAGKDKNCHDESGDPEDNQSTVVPSASLQGGTLCGSNELSSSESQKTISTVPPLHQCNNANVERHIQGHLEGGKDTG